MRHDRRELQRELRGPQTAQALLMLSELRRRIVLRRHQKQALHLLGDLSQRFDLHPETLIHRVYPLLSKGKQP